MELMKAQRMEQLDDTLHDFKNPAIAIAGFARRLKSILAKETPLSDNETVRKYLDILVEETGRIQEMALSIHQAGQEPVVNLTEILKKRFEINKEAIKEMLKANVTLEEGPFLDPLLVRCYPIYLERILDNLFNNATKAIPINGGKLSVRSYVDRQFGLRRDLQHRSDFGRGPAETPGGRRPGPGHLHHPSSHSLAQRPN